MAAKTKTPDAPPATDGPQADAKPLPLNVDLISTPYAVAAVEAERTAPKHARNAMQAAMDKVTQAVYDRWVAAGKPAAWLKMPKAKYPVAPEQAETWRRLISNSAAFIGKRARMGSAGSLCTGLDLDHQGKDEYNPCGECLKIEAEMVAANEGLDEANRLTDEALIEAVKAATGGHELVVFAVLDKRPNKARDEAAANGEATPEAGTNEGGDQAN